MATHVGYIVQINELRKHPNADRLQIATIFGNSVIVDLTAKVGDIGIYFPIDLQLSEEYCAVNNLVRRKDENGNNVGGYLDPAKRNIRAMKLRGEKSEGLFMPLHSLDYLGIDGWSVGQTVDKVGDHEICCKYIPRTNVRGPRTGKVGKTTKSAFAYSPLFVEHAETEQLAYNLGEIRYGDHIEITLKMHGTSGRTGYLPVFQREKKTLWQKIFHKKGTPIYEYGYVSGTRRTVLKTFEDGGYYGTNEFRKDAEDLFKGKLHKGEEVYYEIVGFTNDGRPIMPSVSNNKTNDKEFIKQYGEMTEFSYGCNAKGFVMKYGCDDMGQFSIPEVVPQHDVYVYRMTMTNEDGDVVEYSPDFMRYRCEQMGVKSVPVFTDFIIPEAASEMDTRTPGEMVKDACEQYYDGADPVGKTHIREGVVARVTNRPTFTAYKHKNFYFKVLSGIAINEVKADDYDADTLSEI